MIYGQDQAVRYPVKDLYDTGMMNLYITAIKDEYERGIKEQEEFISKYGDFISPFQKDVENWDRLTMDPIIEAYDYLQKNGIDPLRSQEGRALLADIRRKVPREKLSMLRQSAAAGQEYLSNRAKLQAAGQYNPEFEQFLLGDRTFEGQDTLSQGMWDRTAPTEFKGLRTLTDPWFKNRTAKYKGTKGGYDYYGYDVKDMKTATNDQIQAFLSNDYGRYYYDQALKVAQASRQPGESDESVRKRAQEILVNDIVDVNRDYLLEDRKANQFALEEMSFRNEVRLASMQRRWAKEDAEEARRNLYPASWTGMLSNDVAAQRGDKQLGKLKIAVQYMIDLNKTEKAKYKKDSKQYKWHQAQEDAYSKYLSKINDGKAGYTVDRFGIKHLSENAEKTIKYYDNHRPRNTVNDQIDWLNNNSFEISEPNSRNWALEFVSTNKTKIDNGAGGQIDKGVMTFGGTNNVTRVRTGNLSGRSLTSNSPSVKFNNFLRGNKVQGLVDRNSIRVSKTPRKYGGAVYDFTYSVDIPKSVVEQYIRYDRTGDPNADIDVETPSFNSYLKSLGGTTYSIPRNNKNESPIEMVRISATTSANESRLNSFFNSLRDQQMYGASNAFNLSPTRQGESIDASIYVGEDE